MVLILRKSDASLQLSTTQRVQRNQKKSFQNSWKVHAEIRETNAGKVESHRQAYLFP